MPADETPLIFRYRLNPADYYALTRALPWTRFEKAVRATWFVGLVAVAIIAGDLIWMALGERHTAVRMGVGVTLTAAACFASLLVFYSVIVNPAYLKSVFSGQVIAGGETELSIDRISVSYAVNDVRVTVPWRIMQIVERSRHYFLFYTRMSAVILPKRAFAGEADHALFAHFAEGHFKLTGPQ